MSTKDLCPICSRELIDDGKSVDKHHFIPKSKGGSETTRLHRVCHRFIHSQWKENVLAKELNTPEKILATPEAQKFITFISKKDPQFYNLTITSKSKRKK